MSESDSAKTKTVRSVGAKQSATRSRTGTNSVRKTATKKTARKTATKKTATKKATRKTATKKATRKTATKKTTTTTTASAAKSVETDDLTTPEESETVSEEVVALERKAPTVQPSLTPKKINLPPIPHMVVGAIASLLLVSSAVIGMSDPGEISIQGVVTERNQEIMERQERGEEVTDLIIPVQDSSSRASRPQLRPSAAGRSGSSAQQNGVAGTATSTDESIATTTATTSDANNIEDIDEVEEEVEDLPDLPEEIE